MKITEPKPGAYVFDLGQNFAGFARLKAHGRGRHEDRPPLRRSAQPRRHRSTPTNLRERSRRSTPTCCKGDRRRGLATAVHFPRLPLRRGDGLSRQARRKTPLTGIAINSKDSADRDVRVFQPDGKQAVPEYRLDPAGELHFGAHRLPAARRAAGLDRRCRDVRSRRPPTTPT